MKIKFNFLLTILMIFFISLNSFSQMSFYSTLDTMQGFSTKAIPTGNNMIIFSSPQFASDSVRLIMTKLDKCRNVDWIKKFHTKDIAGISNPDAIVFGDIIFVLLKPTSFDPGKFTLIKMTGSGVILWSKNYDSKDFASKLSSEKANIHFSELGDYIYLVTGDEKINTVILCIDLNGEIVHSKKLNGLLYNSSVLNGEGDLIVFSVDGRYAKIDLDNEIIDSVVWVKKLKNRKFDNFKRPVSVFNIGDTSVIAAIVDKDFKVDTAIYRLVKFNSNGDIIAETDGFYAPDYSFGSRNSLTTKDAPSSIGSGGVYYMIKNKVYFFNTNLQSQLKPTLYKFSRDDYLVKDASLEICEDETLVMTGYCYQNKDDGKLNMETPYMFASKTQNAEKQFKVEAEEENCLNDSTSNEFDILTDTEVDTSTLIMDTTELKYTEPRFDFTFVNEFFEEKCGKINMEAKDEPVKEICPGEEISFIAPTLKCSDQSFKWSSGELDLATIIPKNEGKYSCTVTYCDTVKVSNFELKFKDNCVSDFYPNAFFPDGKDSFNLIFNVVLDINEESTFEFTEYNLSIFDRWGEKVFETSDANKGWDGKFRDKDMPPGVYLYSLTWKGLLNGVKEYSNYDSPKKGQVMLLR